MSFSEGVLRQAAWRVLCDYAGREEFVHRIHERLIAVVSDVCGKDAGGAVAKSGLDRLHEQVAPDSARSIAEAFVAQENHWLIERFQAIALDALALRPPFLMHARTTMRVVFPFDIARTAKITLADHLSRLKEPIQSRDPLAVSRYHRDLPLAAWTHGPHVDSWWGQPFDGLNLWMAVSGVNRRNGIYFFERRGHATGLPHLNDPPYVAAEVRLPYPSWPDPRDGEMILFDAEVLHATNVNVSSQTRISLALRYNNEALRFDGLAARRHSDWLRVDPTIRNPNDTMGALAWREGPETERGSLASIDASAARNLGPIATRILSSAVPDDQTAHAILRDTPVILARQGGVCRAFRATCPHLGLPLDGAVRDGSHLICPHHGLRFRLADGVADCGTCRLEQVHLRETAGHIEFDERDTRNI